MPPEQVLQLPPLDAFAAPVPPLGTRPVKTDMQRFKSLEWHFGHTRLLSSSLEKTRVSNLLPHLAQRYSRMGMPSLAPPLKSFVYNVFTASNNRPPHEGRSLTLGGDIRIRTGE